MDALTRSRSEGGRIMKERKSFLIRIDPTLHAELERWAAAELRSVNGQIEYLLKEAVRRRGVPLPPDSDEGNRRADPSS
jgi:hypothetical protein